MSDGGGFWSRAKRVMPRRPELTPEALLPILQQGFAAGRYEVYPSKLAGVDLVIRKSAWTGIAVKIKQTDQNTILRYNPFSPSAGVRLLQLGVIPLLIMYAKSWKPMMAEFREFLDRTPQFQK